MCGGPGMGKSMRAKRLMAILCDGWIKGSGSASAKAGMNGGMDYLCGRLVYYDEVTSDFSSNDSDRIEYLKTGETTPPATHSLAHLVARGRASACAGGHSPWSTGAAC